MGCAWLDVSTTGVCLVGCIHHRCVPGWMYPPQVCAWLDVSTTGVCLAGCIHPRCVPGWMYPSQVCAWLDVSTTGVCLAGCIHHRCVPGWIHSMSGSLNCSVSSHFPIFWREVIVSTESSIGNCCDLLYNR